MPDTLRRTLQELQEQLEEADGLDDEAVAELRATMDEIQRHLEAAGEEPSGLRDRFTAALERFEGEHPQLTAAINRVADALADMGI